jgi:hypothetical protein
VRACEQLLAEAKSGNVIGIAYAVMSKRRECWTDAAGECWRNPTFARGIVMDLSDKLGRRARSRQ